MIFLWKKNMFLEFWAKRSKLCFQVLHKKRCVELIFPYSLFLHGVTLAWRLVKLNELIFLENYVEVFRPKIGRNEPAMRFIKIYQKSTCGIFLIKAQQHKVLKLTEKAFFWKSCTGDFGKMGLVGFLVFWVIVKYNYTKIENWTKEIILRKFSFWVLQPKEPKNEVFQISRGIDARYVSNFCHVTAA